MSAEDKKPCPDKLAEGMALYRQFEADHFPINDITVLNIWEADDADVREFVERLFALLGDRS